MIVVPIDSNKVEISKVQTGCCKAEFNSTYPVHLRGIISPDEFQESIRNINQVTSSRTSLIVCGLLAILCLVGGIALFIAGGITAATAKTFVFLVLIGVGFGVLFLGMIVLIVGCCIVQTRLAVRMQRAIANESMKYSTRSPTPCSWRLETLRIPTGGYRNRRAVIVHRIVIEIAHSGAAGSGNVAYQLNQPTSSFSQQNNMFTPSPYNNHSAGEFCSRCGAPQRNPTGKFCSSCGQVLNT